MCVCVYIYMCVCVCVCVYIYIYIYIYIYVYIFIYVCMYVCIHSMHTHIDIHTYISMYIYFDVDVYIQICTYVHIYRSVMYTRVQTRVCGACSSRFSTSRSRRSTGRCGEYPLRRPPASTPVSTQSTPVSASREYPFEYPQYPQYPGSTQRSGRAARVRTHRTRAHVCVRCGCGCTRLSARYRYSPAHDDI